MAPSFATTSAQRCIDLGPAALTQSEQQAIANLFRDETRKGSFVIPEQGALRSFCEHVLASFPDQHTTQIVYDYLPHLQRRGRSAARGKAVPLVALILYATWVEHWTNMVLTVGMLRRGQTEAQIGSYFSRQPRFEDKVGQLGGALGLPPLGAQARAQLLKLMRCRNDFVHYTWEGSHIGAAKRRQANIRNIVQKAPALLATLRAWEFRALDAPNITIIRRLLPKARLRRPRDA